MLIYTKIDRLIQHIDAFFLKYLNINLKGEYAIRLNNSLNYINKNEEIIFKDDNFYYIRKSGELAMEQTTNRQSNVLTFNTSLPIKFFFKFNRNGMNQLNEEILYMNIIEAIRTYTSEKNSWIIPQSVLIETFAAFFAEYGDETENNISLPDSSNVFMISVDALLNGIFEYSSCEHLKCC